MLWLKTTKAGGDWTVFFHQTGLGPASWLAEP